MIAIPDQSQNSCGIVAIYDSNTRSVTEQLWNCCYYGLYQINHRTVVELLPFMIAIPDQPQNSCGIVAFYDSNQISHRTVVELLLLWSLSDQSQNSCGIVATIVSIRSTTEQLCNCCH